MNPSEINVGAATDNASISGGQNFTNPIDGNEAVIANDNLQVREEPADMPAAEAKEATIQSAKAKGATITAEKVAKEAAIAAEKVAKAKEAAIAAEKVAKEAAFDAALAKDDA
jgi:hypothetical protein